ncbi:MAG: glycosyltransferase family 39 protein, partial [Verrucomicrobiota bacterium]
AVLLAVLAVTARWWQRTAPRGLYDFPRPAMPRWFIALTLLAMLVCAVFGVMRLQHSFWDDEVYAMRRSIYGQWKTADDGTPKFRPVKWTETFFFFEKPQHVLHSIVTRLTLDAWRAVARPQGLKFREDVVRIPSYLAGILSVGALALLLWRLGFPAAGVIAAFLLVLHPWHIRYASELRAYSFMLAALPLSYLFLIEALTTGLWRWWLAYAAGLFLFMYSNALNIYPALGLGLCGFAAVLMPWRDPRAPVQIMRFAVATLLAGMAFFQLMLPCVPQFLNYLHGSAVRGPMGLAWLSNYFSLLLAGIPWNPTRHPVSIYLELYPRVVRHPEVFIGLVVLVLFLFSLGTRRLCLKGRLQTLVSLALLLPAPIAYAISRARDQHLFEWYLLFLLPGAIAVIALGLDAWRQNLARRKAGTITGILLVAGLIGVYVCLTAPQRTWLLTRPLQQIRESVEITRPTLDPLARENIKILTASFIGPPDPYDPAVIRFTSVRTLADLMSRADAEKKTLFLNFGFLITAQIRYPTLLKMIEDPALFEKVAELQGFEPINDRFVYRYKSGSAASRSLTEEFRPAPETEIIENRYDAE